MLLKHAEMAMSPLRLLQEAHALHVAQNTRNEFFVPNYRHLERNVSEDAKHLIWC
jgi:hypothetical protein